MEGPHWDGKRQHSMLGGACTCQTLWRRVICASQSRCASTSAARVKPRVFVCSSETTTDFRCEGRLSLDRASSCDANPSPYSRLSFGADSAGGG